MSRSIRWALTTAILLAVGLVALPSPSTGVARVQAIDVQPRVYLPLVLRPAPWTTILTETFEGTFPGPWVLSWPTAGPTVTWGKSNCSAYEGSYSGWALGTPPGAPCGTKYLDYMNGWMVYGPFSLQGAHAADLKFMLWQNTESGIDGVFVGASTDGNNFDGSFPVNSGTWLGYTLDLNRLNSTGRSMLGQSQVWIAFVFESDYDTNYPNGSFIDNITLRKCTETVCPGAVTSVGLDASSLRESGSVRLRRP